jgi:hypothetical protein
VGTLMPEPVDLRLELDHHRTPTSVVDRESRRTPLRQPHLDLKV